MKPLAPNSLIQNRYLVVQLIGKGGMGDVYLAVDQRLGSAIALKRTFFTDDEVLKNAFEREAKTLARLRHSALPKVSDHFDEGDTQFLVMEHISGDDLSARLEQQKKPFLLSWVLFWADQLLDALSYLHSHEPPIIHRDIKPQNLKLTNDNHIILLDFGLAKNSVGETRLSTTGDVIAYTPHYASMEQIRGTGTTARSDIYSLSATIYELLSNTVPPDALSRADAILNSSPDPLKPLSDLNPEVSKAVSEVIIKGLNLSAEQRFANAREMQTALREAYSQVQESAPTVAFNTDKIEPPTVSDPAGIKTVPFISGQSIGEKTEVMPIETGEKTEVKPMDIGMQTIISPIEFEPTPTADVAIPDSVVNVDSTLPFVAPLIFDQTQNNQSVGEKTEVMPLEISTSLGEKTEIMPADISTPVGEKTEVIPIDVSSIITEQPDAVAAEIVSPTQENVVSFESGSYSPDATAPMLVYDGPISEMPNQATADYVSSQGTGAQTENYPIPTEPSQETSVPVHSVSNQRAAGGGKMFLIIGLILGLGFLALAGTGVGLYMFKPEIFGISTTTPTPTASPADTTPTPAVSPSLEKTLEISNSNQGDSNSDSSNINSGGNDSNPPKTPEIGKDKTPAPIDKNPTPTARPTELPPPTKPPPTKPPPTKPPPTKTATPKPTVCRTCPLQ